ncbi:MAG: nitronate monooxygenase [Candidatus Brocadiia bacterium]|nr:MAG: nitronate monooxygenase [Candidatus Brocadiia bacterium]
MPTLKIGNLEICPPIIQGGMGVRISKANLASAVANEGCVGVIASAGLGEYESTNVAGFCTINAKALKQEIKTARKKSSGILGVNIMVALSDYENLVQAAVDEKIDIIISGAGLPLDLPKYTKGTDIKLIPIVSSARTFDIICKKWKRHFDRLPDAVIVEGVKAGGHLGYLYEDIISDKTQTLEEIVTEVVANANSYTPKIPVIAAGGIYTGQDIARFIEMGAAGVQMATRFVCTDECDAHENFKMAYINCRQEDIEIIQSPVGMPGKVINNRFVEEIKKGKKIPFKCNYHCLRTCDPNIAPYCIAKVLSNTVNGKMDEAFAFEGSNAWKCDKIVSVKSLIKELIEELKDSLSSRKPSLETLCHQKTP